MTVDMDELQALLPKYFATQRWYSGSPESAEGASIESSEVLRPPSEDEPGLLQVVASAGGNRYQLLVGLRPVEEQPAFLHGHESSVIGKVDDDGRSLLAYDGLLDPDLALVVLRRTAPEEEPPTRVRPLAAEQSNTSIVFDDRIIVKVFRRLQDGGNPDVEVTQALRSAGFEGVAEPLGAWRGAGADLAFAQRFLAGSADGWALALTSLRDCYGGGVEPSQSGGDFAAEAERLGTITARMHVAMARAFGVQPAAPGDWADVMDAQLREVAAEGDAWAGPVGDAVRRLRETDDVGVAIRVHGDYHLGQVLRTDAGWYILDFEGEPARPIEERMRPTSPLKDVGGMLRSFHYAAASALSEREEHERETLQDLAAAWEQRNRSAFLEGYLTAPGIDELLPTDLTATTLVLNAFELDKAVYELAYERAHRPDWEAIPIAALSRPLPA